MENSTELSQDYQENKAQESSEKDISNQTATDVVQQTSSTAQEKCIIYSEDT